MSTGLRKSRWVAVAVAITMVIFLLPSLYAQNAPAGNVQKGQAAYVSRTCNACHGANAEGAIGPRIGPPEPSYADFVKYVRMPEGKMLAFSSQAVPDSDLADIYAFLRSKPAPAQPSFSAARGNATHGKEIYTAYGCYQCHGSEGQGSTQTFAPHIGPPGLSLAAFAGYIRQPTAVMPPYTAKAVSDQDVADIYAFLKTIPEPPPAKSIPLLN